MKFLIVGLGNIGASYELTRHNIGFLILDRIADTQNAEFETSRLALKTEVKYKGRQLHLIKPTTFMNASGKAVSYWMSQLKIAKENLLIIVDDIALPFGQIRLKPRGSSAGHNGLKNIEEMLNSQEYPRLRFGIGDNFGRGQQIDYVLSNFNSDELDALPAYMDKAGEAIYSFCTVGMERTMNLFN